MNTEVQESQGIMGSIATVDDVKMDKHKFLCLHMDK
jgi:hypothetical protein